jgi:HEAT repeat protein
MKQKWMDRWFSRLEPEPFWLEPDAPLERGDLIIRLLEGLRGPFATKSAARLREIVGELRMAERVRVDEVLRRQLTSYYGWGVPNWLNSADDVRRLPLPAGTEGAVLGLIAAAPSGYVREAAVQRLALLGGGDEVAPLLIRAADWVAPVRSRALDALRARLVPAYAEHWVAALPLVLRLRGTGRGEAWPLVDEVMALLRQSESREAVWTGMHASRDRTVRRACFRILLGAGLPALSRLVRLAQHNADEVVRLEAARAAAPLGDGDLLDLLPGMLADPYPRVRLVALGLAAERMGTSALPALRGMLLDRAPTTRGEARALIDRLEPMDFAEYYRDRIAPDAPRLAEAVAGLAETGAAEDAYVVEPLLAHSRPRVRAAALRALVRLTGDAAVPALVAALGDGSASVSRVAADGLRPRAARADVAALGAWFSGDHAPHVRRNALALLAVRGKWDGIAWILQACGDADPTVHEAGMRQLRWWHQRFNRSFTQPAPAQQERIRAALAQAGDVIDPGMAKWLRFVAGIEG